MKINKNCLVTILVVLLSSYSFPQLDSVYHKGPSVGSVSAGAIQTTDNFSDINLSPIGENKTSPFQYRKDNDHKDFIIGWDQSLLPEFRYIEDSHKILDNSSANGQTVLLNSFTGIPMTNYIPPDPTIAVGPEHIIICANSAFRILDKNGNVLKNISAATWWAPVWPDESGDPQVIYDHYAERWVLLWMQVSSQNLTAGNLIAYSDDNNPLGSWYLYRLDTKMHGTVASNTWGDYPKVGFDEEALYIMTRCIPFSGSGFYNKIRIINKSEFYNSNAGPLSYTDIWDIRTPAQGSSGAVLDCINPGISYTPGEGGWFFWAAGIYGGSPVSADFYAMYRIINPLTSPRLRGKVLPVQMYTSPPLANQLGGGMGLETIGWITKGPVIRDNYLYVAHDIQNSTNQNYSSIKYLKVNLNTYSIIDNIEYGSIGYFYLFPAITVDQNHNAAITFSRSADNEYVGAYYTSKHSTSSDFIPSKPFAEGQGNYEVTYGGNINRWGDYFGIYLDPANNLDVWMISEFAAATNTWGTQVGKIRMEPYPGAYAFAESFTVDFGNLEIGSTPITKSVTLSNYGEDNLVINSIGSPVGPFTLLTNLTIPYTLVPYDSLELEFEFDPTDPVVYDELISFANNDPNFSGFRMKGRGFEINETNTNVFYAVSNATFPDTGKTLTINKTSGSGSELGRANFTEVRGLTVDPLTNILFGVVPGSTSSDIIRINAAEGDAYTYLNLPGLGFLIGLAFDTTGTLYGALQNGGIYKIDLSNGTTTLITTTVQLTSIAFDPTTNELWATPRVLVGQKDRIFKIDLATGDTTVIGRTGFNVQTNDLAFDETGALYGVIGGTTDIGKLISIDKTTAAGTEVGETGYTNVQSLAYRTGGTSSVNEIEQIPGIFSLEQNYPNPFNPSTVISYQLPVSGDVTLKVFDILGNEVATLVNELKPAGNYEVEFDASSLTSGVYFYKLQAGTFVDTKKMVLLK